MQKRFHCVLVIGLGVSTSLTIPLIAVSLTGLLWSWHTPANAQSPLERLEERIQQLPIQQLPSNPAEQAEEIPPGIPTSVPPVPQAGGNENRVALGLEAEERGFAAPYAITVIGVRPGTPAERAGLKPGDIIKTAAGQPIGSIDELAARVQNLPAGGSLTLGIQRGNTSLQTVAKFTAAANPTTPSQGQPQASQPGQPPRTAELMPSDPQSLYAPPLRPEGPLSLDDGTQRGVQPLGPTELPVVERPEPGSGRMGVTVENVATTPPGPGVPVKRGAVVVAISDRSPAAMVGIKPGDVIVAIDGVVIRDAAALIEEVSKTRPGQRVELGVYQGESLAKLAVILAEPSQLLPGNFPPAINRNIAEAAPGQEPTNNSGTGDAGKGLLGAIGGFFGGNKPKAPAEKTGVLANRPLSDGFQPDDPPTLSQPPSTTPFGTAGTAPLPPQSETGRQAETGPMPLPGFQPNPVPGGNPIPERTTDEVSELKNEIQLLRLQLESLQKRLNQLEGN